jgi:hypothetical protein
MLSVTAVHMIKLFIAVLPLGLKHRQPEYALHGCRCAAVSVNWLAAATKPRQPATQAVTTATPMMVIIAASIAGTDAFC